ncbi:MAG: hypothetical protein K8F91_02975, partial [Candidatus Obscuribacterales bacterium]|nr:hypothetical protein [Candidatus Obscuribacterales bacterium]
MLTLSFLFGCSSKAASPNACPVAKGDPASKQTSQGNEEQSAFAGTSSEFVNFVSSLGQANGEERITRLEEYRTRLLGSPTEKQ